MCVCSKKQTDPNYINEIKFQLISFELFQIVAEEEKEGEEKKKRISNVKESS